MVAHIIKSLHMVSTNIVYDIVSFDKLCGELCYFQNCMLKLLFPVECVESVLEINSIDNGIFSVS